MPRYETEYFENELVIPEGDEVVEAHISPTGTRQSSSAQNVALVRRSEDDPQRIRGVGEVRPSNATCDYPTDDGLCQRTVEDPDDYCWQHEETDE